MFLSGPWNVFALLQNMRLLSSLQKKIKKLHRLRVEESASHDNLQSMDKYISLTVQLGEENIQEQAFKHLKAANSAAADQPTVQTSEIFDSMSDTEDPKNVLVKGKAGVGKTTFLKKILFDWSFGKLWKDRFHCGWSFVCESSKIEFTNTSVANPSFVRLSAVE